jgi:hypothetical protein
MKSAFCYRCRDCDGMEACPASFVAEKKDEVWKLMELLCASCTQRKPGGMGRCNTGLSGHSDKTSFCLIRKTLGTTNVILGSIRISYAHGLTGRIPAAAARTARGVGCLGSTAR